MFHSEYEARLRLSPKKIITNNNNNGHNSNNTTPSKEYTTPHSSPLKQSPVPQTYAHPRTPKSSSKESYSDRFIPIISPQDVQASFSMLLIEPHSKSAQTNVSNSNSSPNSSSSTSSSSSTIQAPENTHKDDNQATYNLILKQELLGDCVGQLANDDAESGKRSSPSRNLFQYKKAKRTLNLDSDPYSLSPMSATSQMLLSSPRKPQRKISKVPFKVLEAPGILDDFYLNLLDWSSQNILAVGLGSSVYLWSAATTQVTRLTDLESSSDSVTSVNWMQRGTHLAIGTEKGNVQLWDVIKKKQVRSMTGHRLRVGVLAWNSHTLSSGGRDQVIYHRDVRASDNYTAKLTGHKQEVCGLKWSPDGQQLASGGNDNRVFVWDSCSTSPVLKYVDHISAVKAIAWSPHQRGLLASGGGTADKSIRFWNTLSGVSNAPLQVIDTGSQVCNLAWSKNVNELVSTHGYSQNQITVWNYPSMTQLATLTGHTMRVLYLATSPDGQTIVTGAGDETLRFWNVFPDIKEYNSTSTSGIVGSHSLFSTPPDIR